MKTIEFLKGYNISAFNGATEEITIELLNTIMKPIEINKANILDVANDIENRMSRIITHHFFRSNNETLALANEFNNQILNSDWCTFSSKKKLLVHIINSKAYLTGTDKSNFDNLLSKVMKYRNAFVHGEFHTDGREVRLYYFEGINMSKTLTIDYFNTLKKEIDETLELLNVVSYKSGAIKDNLKSL